MYLPRLADVATTNVITLNDQHSIQDAVHLMAERHLRDVVVTGKQGLRIITTRELILFRLQELDFNLPLHQVTLNPVPTLTPEKNVLEGLEVIRNHPDAYLCLLDESGQLCGIVSATDLASCLDPQHLANTRTLAEIVRSNQFVRVQEKDDVRRVFHALSTNRQTAALVFAEEKAVGLITQSDVIKWFDQGGDTGASAARLMSAPLKTFNAQLTLAEALDTTRLEKVKRLVVTDPESGDLLGLLHQEDLVSLVYQDWAQRLTSEAQRLRTERDLFAGGPVVVFKWRPEEGWPIDFVSPNVKQVLGYTPNDLMAEDFTFATLVHPDDLQRIGAEVSDYLAEKRPFWEQDYRLIDTQGKAHWFYDYTRPVYNHQGEVTEILGYMIDKTKAKEVEQNLREAETRFQQLASSVDVVFWIRTPEAMLYVNQAYVAVWGRSCESLYKNPNDFIESVHPDDQDRLIQALQASDESGEFEQDYRILRPDGEIRWVRVSSFAVEGAEDYRSAGTATDITEQKLQQLALEDAKATLQVSEAKYRTLLENLPVLIFRSEINPPWKMHHASQNAEQLCGYTSDEFLIGGLTWAQIIVVEDLARVDAAVQESIKVNQKYSAEYRIRHKNGHLIWVSETGSAQGYDRNGQPTYLDGVITDITVRKELERQRQISEQRFNDVIAAAGEYVWEVDLKGRFLFASEQINDVLGVTAQEVLNHTPFDFIPDDEQTRVAHYFSDKAKKKLAFKDLEHPSLHRQGHLVWQRVSGVPVYSESGEIVAYRGTAMDITEQRSYQEKLKQAKHEAEAASKAKSQFLANMSHEIRTPLNAILGLTELQLEEKKNHQTSQRLEQVYRSGQLLLGIVNDLLDFSKIEAGKLTAEQVPFELDAVSQHLATLFDLQASRKGLEFIVNLQPDLPRQLKGDSLHLGQVLTNLTANAIKFTEQGFVEVAISQQASDEQSLTLGFSVRDSGLGISEEQQQHLFQAFQQADDSITRKYGGTGLGLVISQRLVQLMGGSGVHLQSQLGQGSCFSFELTFPLAENLSSFESIPGCHTAECRALVVDDQPIARAVLREMLQTWGYEVLEAEDGYQALEIVEQDLQQERVLTVILMDWEMPRMNGLTALQKIRELLESQPQSLQTHAMLMVSAHDRAEIMDANDRIPYLAKPVQRSNLYNALNHLQQPVRPAKEGDVFCQQQVLVVEDNRINQQVVQEHLEHLGLQIQIAENGLQGVQAVQSGDIDLVLMDIQMPEMDGYEATRQIRQEFPDLPIIALTAAALFEDRQKALDAGMNDHLGKPFTGEQLFTALKPWLTTRSREDQPATPATPPAIVQPRINKMLPSILIVDDQPANIKVLASQLKADYRIHVANSGPRALKIARSEAPPDLVLLDIMMPEMDGYEVCRELKHDPKTSHIPIIFLSALSEAEDEEKALNLGAVDYIAKPFHPAIVKARIRNHMNLKMKTDLLEDMSQIDGLTQIANRRFFDSTLKREASRLARNGKPLGLIMMDIDFFKPFNDNYGHGKGDECLIKVAATLQTIIKRPGDLLARYGGEEFVALLPETNREGVKRVAEALRLAVEQLDYPHEFSQITPRVTISVGGVSVVVTDQITEADMLKQADETLYQAKKAGRNCALVAR